MAEYLIEELLPDDYMLEEESLILDEDPINTAKQVYRVFCDGYEILDYSTQDLILLNPKVELEINTAGSFEFTMPPYHIYYDFIRPLVSTLEVYEDETLIWFGRPVEVSIDFYKQKKVYCEGPLSFFNDSVQFPREFEDYSLRNFFQHVINTHNSQVSSNTRRFQFGNFTVDDKPVYRKLNYESTYDVLTSMCLDAEDGYFFFRKENGVIYIDWLKDLPFTCNQPIQFALNLLDYNQNFDGKDFATCVLPVGAINSDTDQALTIADVNNGSDILQSEAVKVYGNIIKAQTWSDIETPWELKSEGQKYLEITQFNSLSIECNAADLHSMNGEYELFRVGQNVHCISNPHLIDRDFPISKMSLQLDSALKTITLGIIKKKTLTRIYKRQQEEPQYEDYGGNDYTPSYDPGVISDENGDPWVLVPPEEPGDPVTAVRLPIKITVARMPNKVEYEPGEDLDFTGLAVNIWTKNKDDEEIIWTNPPRYIDGTVPMAELVFSAKTAPDISEFSIDVIWTYKGKRYHTSLKFSTEETGELVPNVMAAGVEICHLDSSIYDRHFTTITATPAKAGCWFNPTGNPIYSYIIVSRDADGCRIHCQDVRSSDFTRDLGASGTIEIEDVTYYYGAQYGLYTSYGGHAVSHIGPMVQAESAAEAVRKLLTGG